MITLVYLTVPPQRQPRPPGLSHFLREFLQILDYTSLFHDQVDAQSILLWNLVPHGYEKSDLHIDHLFGGEQIGDLSPGSTHPLAQEGRHST